MCGIFGIISKTSVIRQQFCQLAERNQQRGNLAFGYFTAKVCADSDQTTSNVFRYPHAFDQNLLTEEKIQISLGHILAPTAGKLKSVAEIHPFKTRDGYLAHNGLLLNYKQFASWRINSDLEVDSQVIIGGVQYYLKEGLDVSAAIKKTVEHFEGQQACWYWHKPTQCLYLWRVMAPIYVSQNSTTFYFSSTPHNTLTDSLLKEGTIYQFNLASFTLKKTTDFSFYSPYQL
ncbi:MAG: hypothetical protein Q9M50_03845 [Methylococcales bacterium]|nr:hypothetical protein [Methylococcales bacterium]